MTAQPEQFEGGVRSETRADLIAALVSVDADIAKLETVRIALTDALFLPSSVDAQAPTERVSDERLEHLGRELRRLETVEGTSIIPSLWNPGEIYSIVEEVMRSRLMDQVVFGGEEMKNHFLNYLASKKALLVKALAGKREEPIGQILLAKKQFAEDIEHDIKTMEVRS